MASSTRNTRALRRTSPRATTMRSARREKRIQASLTGIIPTTATLAFTLAHLDVHGAGTTTWQAHATSRVLADERTQRADFRTTNSRASSSHTLIGQLRRLHSNSAPHETLPLGFSPPQRKQHLSIEPSLSFSLLDLATQAPPRQFNPSAPQACIRISNTALAPIILLAATAMSPPPVTRLANARTILDGGQSERKPTHTLPY